MTKIYKHKTLPWIAEKNDCWYECERFEIWIETKYALIPIEIIEWCSDREEVVKTKDWIDEALEEVTLYTLDWWCEKRINEPLKEILRKRQPKLRKFTREEIIEYHTGAIDNEWQRRIHWHDINPLLEFLKVHWLLEE